MSDSRTTNDAISRLWQEAEFYEQQGLYDHAVIVYQNILEREPDNRKVQAKIVQIHFNRKIEDTTPSQASSDPEERSPRLALDLGIAYMGMHLYPEALEEFRKALEPSPVFRTEILRYMAISLIRSNRYEEAQQVFYQLLDDGSLTATEKEDISTEILDTFLELGLAGQIHALLTGIPDELQKFVKDYEGIVEELSSMELSGTGFEVLVEDTDTGEVYRESLSTLQDEVLAESPTQDLEASIPLKTAVSYSVDNKVWREGMSSRISADWAVLQIQDQMKRGDSVVLQIQIPTADSDERVWVVSRVDKLEPKSSEKSGEVRLRFVSFLPGGETILKKFIDEVVRDPSLLSAEGVVSSQVQPTQATTVFSGMDTHTAKVDVPDDSAADKAQPYEETDAGDETVLITDDVSGTRAEQKPRIRFACECGQVHVVPIRTVGRKGKCAKCGRTMTVPVIDMRPDSISAQMIGQIVGGCRLLYKIGGGGMGGVFKGHHIALDIPVAVKVLHAHLAEKDPVFIRRFIREARSAAKLQHPNVVGVLNVGVEGSLHFLVMPYVEGGSAATLLAKTGKFRLEKVLHIAVEIARALTVAEEKGMLHRDIKPANILFTKKGDAMLADLGLAKNYLDSQDSGITQTGIACGTPLYFSPEQAKGSPNMDIRSDIYSLGITLFHLLEGTPPFTGESAYVIFQKHVHEPLPRFKQAEDVPDAVCKMIQKMTAKDPKERYPGAHELLAALEELREDMLRGGQPKRKTKRSLLERLGIKKSR
ncbi:MAG TPA: protein kinase [Desulfomonilaceae bacterium]|nr:protein kinase [Desulfomonilaceae bacterium]